jgi:DNA-binding transcriptional ArsR family regulator
MTIRDNTVPIKIDALEDGQSIPVKPGTNAHRILAVLVENADLAFSPAELVELTEVPRGSVGKTLARLEEKGLVRSIDGYWAAADDLAARQLAGYVSLAAIEGRYGDDAYGRDDDGVEDLPDLGENA